MAETCWSGSTEIAGEDRTTSRCLWIERAAAACGDFVAHHGGGAGAPVGWRRTTCSHPPWRHTTSPDGYQVAYAATRASGMSYAATRASGMSYAATPQREGPDSGRYQERAEPAFQSAGERFQSP